MTSSRFHHPPMTAPQCEIRLLKILPGHFDDEIVCDLFTVALETATAPPYDALSYVWGDPLRRKPIQVNGQRISITVNLEGALRFARSTDTPRILWVDGICINQSDVVEKGFQVGRMGEIYSSAIRGLIWLGDFRKEGLQVEQINSAFDFLQKLANVRFDMEKSGFELDPNFFRDAPSVVLQVLMDNPWWSRIWTIQEVVLPPTVTILWGTQSLPWSVIENAGAVVDFWHENGMPRVDLPEILYGHYFSGQVYAVRVYRNPRENKTDSTPLDVFWRFRARKSTDPRDKVFALLSFLANPGTKLFITPDYTIEADVLYRRVTVKLIQSLGSLKPLIGVRGEPTQTKGLPSWSVDWVVPDRLTTSRYFDSSFRYDCFSCDNRQGFFMETDDMENVLLLHGQQIGIVKTVVDASNIRENYEDITPASDMISMIAQWRKELNLNKIPSQACPESETLEDSFWRTITGGVLTRFSQVSRLITTADYSAFFKFYTTVHEIPCSCKIYDTIRSTITNQLLLITHNGYVGMAPWTARPGDEVWVVAGSQVPLLFRPVITDTTVKSGLKFTLVGDTYVHGVMHGEFVQKSTQQNQVIEIH